MNRVSQLLLRSRDAGESAEAFVAAVEEGHLGSVGGRSSWNTHDVVVGTEESVSPGVLHAAAHVEEVVHGALEPGVAILVATAERLAGIVRLRVGRNEGSVGDIGAVGIEGVDP